MLNSSRNLKLFPEGDPGISEAGDPSRSAQTESTGKTFSEDYVHALRNEAAGYRTQNKTYEAALRKALGVVDIDFKKSLNIFSVSVIILLRKSEILEGTYVKRIKNPPYRQCTS